MNVIWVDRSKRDLFLSRVLIEWDRLLRHYERTLGNEEIPYIYGERTNVGVLAVAAANMGGLTYIEATTDRRRRGKRATGRPDLFVATENGRSRYYLEAKAVDHNPVTDGAEAVETVKRRLREARRQARSVDDRGPNDRIGITFVIAKIKPAETDEYDATEFERRFGNPATFLADFAAVHHCARSIWAKGPHTCPGVALIGRYASSAAAG